MIKYYDGVLALENEMRLALRNQDGKTVRTILSKTNTEIHDLDEWFNRFIELFDHVLTDPDVPRMDPVKRLYNHKYDLYLRLRHLSDKIRYHLNEVASV